MKRVFFLDIDGTILGRSTEVSEYNKNALRTAREQGAKIFINTGRGKACVPDEILDLPLDGMVTGCGCTITLDGTDVFSAVPPLDIVHDYVTGIFERGERCFLEGENRLFRINCDPDALEIDPDFALYCKLARLDFSIWQSLHSADELLAYPDARIPKLNLVGKYTDAEMARYDAHYEGALYPFQFEMRTKGCSKATGMRYVMERYFPDYESVAIGDSANDAEMLACADIAVAMGNASEQIKAMCDIVTDTCDRDGVGKAVIKLIGE